MRSEEQGSEVFDHDEDEPVPIPILHIRRDPSPRYGETTPVTVTVRRVGPLDYRHSQGFRAHLLMVSHVVFSVNQREIKHIH
ncbi:hypothetical protein J6590_013983 [Homalodisca vitripennis]|nr:hypothetical protein J6590_013983 [Homalodisca vitripennis]